MENSLLLILLDGVPLQNWHKLFGSLEGWHSESLAQRFRMRSVLPSISASCYASIHTGVSPQIHGCVGNNAVSRINLPDIFSQTRKKGGITAAVSHFFWSDFFHSSPFDPINDIEYDDPNSPDINHGRFHTMSGYGFDNQMTPSDVDLFATLTMLCQRYKVNYGILHTCTLDSMGHRFGHDCTEMDHACAVMDEMLARFIPIWLKMGYEIIVTADHGQNQRGHHGGHEPDQQDFALYYFGSAQKEVETNTILDQRQLAPTILHLLQADIPETMQSPIFLKH